MIFVLGSDAELNGSYFFLLEYSLTMSRQKSEEEVLSVWIYSDLLFLSDWITTKSIICPRCTFELVLKSNFFHRQNLKQVQISCTKTKLQNTEHISSNYLKIRSRSNTLLVKYDDVFSRREAVVMAKRSWVRTLAEGTILCAPFFASKHG